MSKLRLAIGIPAYGGHTSMHHARMWMEFGNTLGGSHERFELVAFDTVDINGVDQARNYLLARAIAANADWLLMIDADTWVAPSAKDQRSGSDAGFLLLRMISDAARREASIVVAPVVRRRTATEAHETTIYREGLTDATRVDSVGLIPVEPSTLPYGLSEIDAAGAAVFTLNVPKAVEHEALFKFAGQLSEDKHFCQQTRAKGGTIFVDTRVRTGHMSRPFPLYSEE